MFYQDPFDVIIIGGGHAGTEAAMAAARMGQQTLLLTHNIDTLGQMSCNPAIGGIGKGHLVKEVDALGGLMAKAIDHAGIQFRILNASKGPAVRATRAQADRVLYRQAVRTALENQPNLMIFQQAVEDLIVENDRVVGAVTQMGLKFRAKAVVLTVGTFLDGKIHIGLDNYSGVRAGDQPSNPLSRRLRELPLRVTHNDTKLNNVLFDRRTRKALCVLDLDTVMPGSSLYDYGDSIRFGAATAAEDEKDLSKMGINLHLFQVYTAGYLAACKSLTPKELELLPLGAKIITLELAVRFLTDYLDGDRYFRVAYPEHTLGRARAQMTLVADMEAHWDEMQAIVAEEAAKRN